MFSSIHEIGLRTEDLTSMRNGIDATRRAHPRGQRQGQIHIINHCRRKDSRVIPRLLQPIRRLAQNRRHLAPSIRCRDTKMRQTRLDTDRLAQPNRAAPSDGDHRVRSLLLDVSQGFICDVRGRVHRRVGEDASDLALQHILDLLALASLLGRRQDQGQLDIQTSNLIRQSLNSAAAEDYPAGVGVVFEGVHADLR